MTKSNFWVIGGEFGSMNFHKLVEGSAQVQGRAFHELEIGRAHV